MVSRPTANVTAQSARVVYVDPDSDHMMICEHPDCIEPPGSRHAHLPDDDYTARTPRTRSGGHPSSPSYINFSRRDVSPTRESATRPFSRLGEAPNGSRDAARGQQSPYVSYTPSWYGTVNSGTGKAGQGNVGTNVLRKKRPAGLKTRYYQSAPNVSLSPTSAGPSTRNEPPLSPIELADRTEIVNSRAASTSGSQRDLEAAHTAPCQVPWWKNRTIYLSTVLPLVAGAIAIIAITAAVALYRLKGWIRVTIALGGAAVLIPAVFVAVYFGD